MRAIFDKLTKVKPSPDTTAAHFVQTAKRALTRPAKPLGPWTVPLVISGGTLPEGAELVAPARSADGDQPGPKPGEARIPFTFKIIAPGSGSALPPIAVHINVDSNTAHFAVIDSANVLENAGGTPSPLALWQLTREA